LQFHSDLAEKSAFRFKRKWITGHMQVGVSNTPTTPEKGKINKPNAPKTVTSAFL